MSSYIQINFVTYLLSIIPNYVKCISLNKTEILLRTSYINLFYLIYFFKKHTNTLFSSVLDICGADYPQRPLRFDVIYCCFSLKYNNKLRIKVALNEVITIPSISGIFLSSSWFERETWDMFGIFFSEHSRLRRILTDYGFNGYPLRKDFPCVGFFELRYSEESQKVVYEPLELTSILRFN
jgi:NADH dehydrogenase (ubiquinone) Fe-S protein 3